MIEQYYQCTGSPSVCKPICGDGHVILPETCDDGSKNNIGCNNQCNETLEGYICIGGD